MRNDTRKPCARGRRHPPSASIVPADDGTLRPRARVCRGRRHPSFAASILADGGCRRPRAIHSVKRVTLNKCDNIINNRARRICAYVIHPQRCHYFQRSLLQPLTLQARIEDPIHTYIHTSIDRSIGAGRGRRAPSFAALFHCYGGLRRHCRGCVCCRTLRSILVHTRYLEILRRV